MPRTATAPTIEPSRKGIIAVSLLPLDEASRPPPVVARVRGPDDAAALVPWLATAALTSPLAIVPAIDAVVPETPLPLPEVPVPLPEPDPVAPVVVVVAFEPELETAATPFELGEASALELPVMAALVIW